MVTRDTSRMPRLTSPCKKLLIADQPSLKLPKKLLTPRRIGRGTTRV